MQQGMKTWRWRVKTQVQCSYMTRLQKGCGCDCVLFSLCRKVHTLLWLVFVEGMEIAWADRRRSLLWFSLQLSLIKDLSWSVLLAADEYALCKGPIASGWMKRLRDSDVFVPTAGTLMPWESVHECALTWSEDQFSFLKYSLCCWYIIKILHLHTGSQQQLTSPLFLFDSNPAPLTKIWQIDPLALWM